MPVKESKATPIPETIATGFDHAPRLNGPFSVHVLPSARKPAIVGIVYEIYRKTAHAVERTAKMSAYKVERNARTMAAQMAYVGVRVIGLMCAKNFDAGKPPSRAKAYIILEVEVSPASAQI